MDPIGEAQPVPVSVVLLSGLELERDLCGATSHFNDAQGFFVKGLGAGAMERKGGTSRWHQRV